MIAPRALVGPAGADRAVKTLNRIGDAVKPDVYSDLLTWKESAPTVAPESDPRQEVLRGSEFNDN